MQKRKNIYLLVSLSLMIAAILFLFGLNNGSNNSNVDKKKFQPINLEKIDRIVLESTREKIELSFDGTKWLVNNKYAADRQMITVLFAALKQVEAKRKVSASLVDSLQKEILKNGIKVSCYEGGAVSKEFWSLGNGKAETYFLQQGESPYLVTIPGYRVYVASVFEVSATDWRDKQVFNFNWQNIKSLQVTFSEPAQNFKASLLNGVFGIEGISTDTTRLDSFMDKLFQLRADKILTKENTKSYDSLLALNPIERIILSDIGNHDYILEIFPFDKKRNVLIAKTKTDTVLLDSRVIIDLFRKKSFFKLAN